MIQDIDHTQLCSARKGVASTVKCSVYSTKTYDYITITDMFTFDKDAGELFEFYITRLRNPISQSPVAFEISTFESVSEITPDDQ